MRQLNPRDRTLLLDKMEDARQHFHVLIFVYAKIAGRNTAIRKNRAGFGHHQPGAANGAASEMDQMPVIGKAVPRTVLTHRRNSNAVLESDGTQSERFKQMRHGDSIPQATIRSLETNGKVPLNCHSKRGL